MTSKQRYDLKRKSCERRKEKERERTIVRGMRRRGELTDKGYCEDCGSVEKTVWHHETYNGSGSKLVELCYGCHRARHPRAMPHGGVK